MNGGPKEGKGGERGERDAFGKREGFFAQQVGCKWKAQWVRGGWGEPGGGPEKWRGKRKIAYVGHRVGIWIRGKKMRH